MTTGHRLHIITGHHLHIVTRERIRIRSHIIIGRLSLISLDNQIVQDNLSLVRIHLHSSQDNRIVQDNRIQVRTHLHSSLDNRIVQDNLTHQEVLLS